MLLSVLHCAGLTSSLAIFLLSYIINIIRGNRSSIQASEAARSHNLQVAVHLPSSSGGSSSKVLPYMDCEADGV